VANSFVGVIGKQSGRFQNLKLWDKIIGSVSDMVSESVSYLENKFGAGTVLRSYVDSIYIKKTPLINETAVVDELNNRLNGMGIFALEK
jgi:hypothetical protein